MRIVIDLQACQAANKRQGIGRSSLEFTRALLRNCRDHEVLVALNANFPVEADRIRELLADVAGQDQFRVWRTHVPCDYRGCSADVDYRNAIRSRHQYFASLGADVVHSPSLFEGLGDNAVTAVERRGLRDYIESVTLHDLIPLVHDSIYLRDESTRSWYLHKLEELKRADLLLAVSESSREEGLNHLGGAGRDIVNISSGVGENFRPAPMTDDAAAGLKSRFGITQGFVMYGGGIDVRKNVERLIQAYAALPASVRASRQLALVCRVSQADQIRFVEIGRQHGLVESELVFTGYVSDDDLVSLYSLCDLFVFPSWHEGFGLPVLEAMACGAPVIASNLSSLPEVVGRDDALFDPYSVDAICTAMARVLRHPEIASELSRHGRERAQLFTWDSVAIAARTAFEQAYKQRRSSSVEPDKQRPSLAYVSPLPPEQSGISDYSAELLPALSVHYDIVAITPGVTSFEGFPVRSPGWFMQNAHTFDRIVYQFGNSSFHSHMFDLASAFPGAVVLHDFFLSGIVAHLHFTSVKPGIWAEYLYRSHGYGALLEMEGAKDGSAPIWRYPANLPVLQNSLGTIVHSRYSQDLAEQWYGRDVASGLVRIPQLRKTIAAIDQPARDALRTKLGIKPDDLLVCSFGILGPSKRNDALLDAWIESGLGAKDNAHLIFVGEAPESPFGDEIRSRIAELGTRCRITGFVSADVYRDYLLSADFAVQLRSLSRGETSRAALDCMAAGLPLLVNANGSMAELPEGAAVMVADDFSREELSNALLALADIESRKTMSARQRQHVEVDLDPARIAESYRDALEAFYTNPVARSLQALAVDIERGSDPGSHAERQRLAEAVAFNNVFSVAPRQLFVDVSELIKRDSKSGIQRVVHGVLRVLLARKSDSYRVEPVYTNGDGVYRYARDFTAGYLGLRTRLSDETVDFAKGDIFLGLDMSPIEVVAAEAFFQRMRQAGVQVLFIVYDVLPLQRPDCFPPEADGIFRPWTQMIGRCASGLICISRTVASNVFDAMDVLKPDRVPGLPIWSFPLGLSLDRGIVELENEQVASALAVLGAGPVILMVGTLEPRKGHLQALEAFEEMWKRGGDAQLVIVGKQGWMVESLAHSLSTHAELGRRLHWFHSATDSVLDAIYHRSNALLCASEGEGFGLPLLEAFARGIPVIARDIPVFREVGGDRPTYFKGFSGTDLAAAIKRFLGDAPGDRRDTAAESIAGWDASVAALESILAGKIAPLFEWKPGPRQVLWASDLRFHAGEGACFSHGRLEICGETGGRKDALVSVASVPMAPGSYRLVPDIEQGSVSPEAMLEVSARGGATLLRIGLAQALAAPGLARFTVDVECELDIRIGTGPGQTVALGKLILDAVEPSSDEH